MYESYQNNNIRKIFSVKNFFEENKIYQKLPSIRNSKQIGLQGKKWDSSMKNNDEGKAENYFYQLICNNCYNNKMTTNNLKK